MGDIVTGTVTGQVDESAVLRDVGTVRRELAIDNGDIRTEIKDGTNTIKDQSTAFFVASQNTNFQNATALAALTAATNAQFTATQTAIQLAAANNAAAVALSQSNLSALVAAEGEKTRSLLQATKIEDLRFENLKHSHDRNDRHGHRCEGKLMYGPPVSAEYPTQV